MPSKALVKQINMEIGEARAGIAALEAEVQRLETAKEALAPSENGRAPARRPATRRKSPARRKTAARGNKQASGRRAPGSAVRMIAQNLLQMNGESFTVPAFYATYGKGNWNELTTFSVMKRLQGQGMVEKAGKDGQVQLWRVKDREKIEELVAV